MELTVSVNEKGEYVVMVKKPKENPYGACRIYHHWVPAGLDELNEVCHRLRNGTEGINCVGGPWNG